MVPINEKYHLPGKRVIFFDVNQTLIRQNISFEQSFREVWKDYTARWDSEDIPGPEELWQQYMHEWQQRKKLRAASLPLDDVQHQCLLEALRFWNVPVSSIMLRSFMQEVRLRQVSAKTPAPGTLETLDALSGHYRLAIISNSPRDEVLLLLSRFGLTPYFPETCIFTAAKAAEKKPAPTLFKAALGSLQLPSRQAVMVGNSWKHDVVGAVKSGMDAIWLNGSPELADNPETKKVSRQKLGKRYVYLIRRLSQLPSLLSEQ